MFNNLYKKCLNLAAHKSAKYYLAIVSFIESSFFPIPPDVMVIPMVISKKKGFFKDIPYHNNILCVRWHIRLFHWSSFF